LLCFGPLVYAGILDQIQKKGEFVVGVRDGAVPFGFFDKNNERVGFGVDVAKEIGKALEARFGKPIKLILKSVNPETRVPLVANHTVDMVAEATTHTIGREDSVDFSITYFLSGTQILAKKSAGFKSYKDLAGKRVGVSQGSTNERFFRQMNNEGKIKPPVKIVIFQEHPQGLTALQKGIIDAYSTDGILLAGLKAKMPEPDKYELVDDLLTFDPYALVLPHDDSAFRNFVNDQLVKMIKDGRFNQLYKKWFGPDGVVPFPMSQEFKTLLQLEAWPE